MVIHSSTRPHSTLCLSVPGPIRSFSERPIGTSLATALYIPCFLQSLQQPLQRGDSPFSQMRKQVQRSQAHGHSLSKWPIQNSSNVWLQSPFTAPVCLLPPAGVGWNSKGSWGVRTPQALVICCSGSVLTTQLSSVSLPCTPGLHGGQIRL